MKLLPALPLLLAGAMLAGCTTPYPGPSPFPGARVSGNPHPRGSDSFCRTYARQTAANHFEANRDDDGFGSSGFAVRQAEAAGDRSYQRCRAGRTG